MTRKEAVKKAVEHADTGGLGCVLRRGEKYKFQACILAPRGWRVAEMIGPGNVQNFREAPCH